MEEEKKEIENSKKYSAVTEEEDKHNEADS
jgi:hypothetical protein